MNERQLTDLLRLVDEPERLDPDAHRFKERLRVDVEETLRTGGTPDRAQLVLAAPDEAAGRKPNASWLAVAAVVTLVVVGAALLARQAQDTEPADQPVTTVAVPGTTEPVLGPDEACARFRESAAFELLVDPPSQQITASGLADVIAALDVLLTDVEEPWASGPFGRSLRNVRGSVNEARLRLESGDLSGAEQAVAFARLELSTVVAPAEFDGCFAG